MPKEPRQLTATDLIFMGAQQRGKPITPEDLKDSDIIFDLKREEKLLPDNQFPPEFPYCSNGCRSKGFNQCLCHH